MIHYQQQRGIALVMAIMIVALAAITATAITVANQRQTIRTNNLLLRDQAFNFAVSAENFAIRILNEDSEDNDSDNLEEAWYNEGEAIILPIDFANIQNSDRFYIEGQLSDIQSRLSINSILSFPKNNPDQTRTPTLANLFNTLNIDTTIENIVFQDSLQDWLDSDDETVSINGAEQYYYLGLEQPYQIANQEIHHLSTLKQVRGFDNLAKQEYDKLKKELHAARQTQQLNINTASDNILDSIGLNENTIATIVEKRPYDNVADFIKDTNAQSGITFSADDFTIESTYFLLEVTAVMDQVRLPIHSMIERDTNNNTAKVIYRAIGHY